VIYDAVLVRWVQAAPYLPLETLEEIVDHTLALSGLISMQAPTGGLLPHEIIDCQAVQALLDETGTGLPVWREFILAVNSGSHSCPGGGFKRSPRYRGP